MKTFYPPIFPILLLGLIFTGCSVDEATKTDALPVASPPIGYDLVTAKDTSEGAQGEGKRTQTFYRHRFVGGKFVSTEEITHFTSTIGNPGLSIGPPRGPMIWRDHYLVSSFADILDLWTGKEKNFMSNRPEQTLLVLSVSPRELIIQSALIEDPQHVWVSYDRLLNPMSGPLEEIPPREMPPGPAQNLNLYWEVSPDGNRRASHPLPNENPGPNEGLWLYDRKSGEKKFLAGAFYNPTGGHGRDLSYGPCMLWLDNDRFVTYRPDGEIVLVSWDGNVVSLGRPPGISSADGVFILDRDAAGRILSITLAGRNWALVDVEAKSVTKINSKALGHDWDVDVPTSFQTPIELRHAGQRVIKSVIPAIPQVSPDGLNVSLYDADKLQNGNGFQTEYLRVYSLPAQTWVDFPADEQFVAWVPIPPQSK